MKAPDWQSGPHAMYCGDCMEVMSEFEPELFGAVITSPPYNLGTTTGGGFPGLGHYDPAGGYTKRGGGGKWQAASQAGGIGHGYESHGDSMPHGEYVAWQHDVLRSAWELLTPDGAIFYNHKPRILGGRCVTPLEYNPGLPVRQIVIWARAGGFNFSPAFFLPTHEWVVVLAKDPWRLKSKGASGIGDVWMIAQEPNKLHPAPFPLELPCKILSAIDECIVLDPFAGIGTTGRACIRYGFGFVGIEKNRRHFDDAVRLMEEELANPILTPPPQIQRSLLGETA